MGQSIAVHPTAQSSDPPTLADAKTRLACDKLPLPPVGDDPRGWLVDFRAVVAAFPKPPPKRTSREQFARWLADVSAWHLTVRTAAYSFARAVESVRFVPHAAELTRRVCNVLAGYARALNETDEHKKTLGLVPGDGTPVFDPDGWKSQQPGAEQAVAQAQAEADADAKRYGARGRAIPARRREAALANIARLRARAGRLAELLTGKPTRDAIAAVARLWGAARPVVVAAGTEAVRALEAVAAEFETCLPPAPPDRETREQRQQRIAAAIMAHATVGAYPTQKELATEVDVPLGTVKSDMRRLNAPELEAAAKVWREKEITDRRPDGDGRASDLGSARAGEFRPAED